MIPSTSRLSSVRQSLVANDWMVYSDILGANREVSAIAVEFCRRQKMSSKVAEITSVRPKLLQRDHTKWQMVHCGLGCPTSCSRNID